MNNTKFQLKWIIFIFNLTNLIVCKLYLLHNKKREESTSKQVNIGTRASSSFTCSVKCRLFGVKTCAIIAYYIFLFIHLPSSSDSYRCRSFFSGLSLLFSHRIFATFACEWEINHVRNSNELITSNPWYITFDLNLCKWLYSSVWISW